MESSWAHSRNIPLLHLENEPNETAVLGNRDAHKMSVEQTLQFLFESFDVI